jgi:hypothetical protein
VVGDSRAREAAGGEPSLDLRARLRRRGIQHPAVPRRTRQLVRKVLPRRLGRSKNRLQPPSLLPPAGPSALCTRPASHESHSVPFLQLWGLRQRTCRAALVPAPTEATRSAGRPTSSHTGRKTAAASGEVITTNSHSESESAQDSLSKSAPVSNVMHGISMVSTPCSLSSTSNLLFLPSSRVSATLGAPLASDAEQETWIAPRRRAPRIPASIQRLSHRLDSLTTLILLRSRMAQLYSCQYSMWIRP